MSASQALLRADAPAAVPPVSPSVRVVSSVADLDPILPVWEQLVHCPNGQPEFFRTINEARNTPFRIFVIEKGGLPAGLVVCRLVQAPFRCHFGYKTISLGTVKELSVVYGGVLGCDDESTADAVLAAMRRSLRSGDADVASFSSLDTTSVLFRRATVTTPWLLREHLIAPQLHWEAQLPDTMAQFMERMSSRRRMKTRRWEKQLAAAFPGQVKFRIFSSAPELETLMADLEAIAAKTYQRGLGVGFRRDQEFERRLKLEAERGWLRAYVMYLRDQPCVFWVGALFKGVFFSSMTGYDAALREYELGTLIFMRMVEDLCGSGVRAMDFGLGDAEYKQRFGDRSWNESNVRVFAPRARPILLNLGQFAIETPVRWLRALLERLKLQQRVKTFWRRKLAKSSESPET